MNSTDRSVAAAPRGFGPGATPRRWVWVFAAMWLVYLAEPIAQILRRQGTAGQVLGVLGVAAFGALFVLTFAGTRARRRRLVLDTPPWVWCAIAAMIALAGLLAPLAGQSILATSVYIGTLATMTLEARQAWSIVAVLALVIVALSQLVPGWSDSSSYVVQLLLAAFAGWGVSQLILRNIQLDRAREEISTLAVVAERERMGRDIHDILGHSLSVITVKSELARRLLDVDIDRARVELADVERLARESLSDVRATVVGLRNVSLAGELANARSALGAAGIAAQLPNSVSEVPESRRELFAWALREGVTNVVRHSGARLCRVRLTSSSIEIADDGKGIGGIGGQPGIVRGAVDHNGSGLKGLRDRVDAAGASLSLGRSDLGGVELLVVVAR